MNELYRLFEKPLVLMFNRQEMGLQSFHIGQECFMQSNHDLSWRLIVTVKVLWYSNVFSFCNFCLLFYSYKSFESLQYYLQTKCSPVLLKPSSVILQGTLWPTNISRLISLSFSENQFTMQSSIQLIY